MDPDPYLVPALLSLASIFLFLFRRHLLAHFQTATSQTSLYRSSGNRPERHEGYRWLSRGALYPSDSPDPFSSRASRVGTWRHTAQGVANKPSFRGWLFAWTDRVRDWYIPSGTSSEETNGEGLPPTEGHHVKFRMLAPKALRWYITLQYVITLSWLAWFLFQQTGFGWTDKGGSIFLVIWAVVNFTLMFRRKKGGYIMEYFRLIIVVIYAAYLVQGQLWFREVLFTVSGITFFFLIWLLTLNRVFRR